MVTTRCSFCFNAARYKVRRYKLCPSCLKKVCRARGIFFPFKTKTNPHVIYSKRQGIAKGLDGKWFVVEWEGRNVTKIVAGPFDTMDEATGYLEGKRNPRRLTRKKAHIILHEGQVRGRKLTAKQRRYFGARASGYPKINKPKTFDSYIRIATIRTQSKRAALIAAKKYFPGEKVVHVVKKNRDTFLVYLSKLKPNPPDKVKLGRALEVRYKRTVGKHRGNYKHEFETEPELYYRNLSGEVCMR